MHRDHKLGLALGVLVVGFAAALCFPKQTDIDQRLLQLENTADLDAEIARLPVHAYTNADPLPAAATALPETVAYPGPEMIVPGGDDESELLAGPPAPIATTVAASEPLADEFDHELPATAADAGPRNKTPSAATEAIAPASRHYTVRPGDTLSSLAAVLLGNHARYIELFNANREILATPDDLRPGMVLDDFGRTQRSCARTAGRRLRLEPSRPRPRQALTNQTRRN